MMRELLLAAVFSGLALLLVAVTWAIYLRSKARRVARARYFSEVAALFEAPLNAVAATGFPRLSGKINGALFDLQVVPDTLTFRKLPALWLLVTLPEPLPLRATLDMLMRPMGTEPFTNHSKLPQQIATPAGFPPDCVIRTDDPQALPDAALVALTKLGNGRPVNSAARVGEHKGVTWKLVNCRPLAASASMFGVLISEP